MSNKVLQRIVYGALLFLVIYMVGDSQGYWEDWANKATGFITGAPSQSHDQPMNGWNKRLQADYFDNCMKMHTGSATAVVESEDALKPIRRVCDCVVDLLLKNVNLSNVDLAQVKGHIVEYSHTDKGARALGDCNSRMDPAYGKRF